MEHIRAAAVAGMFYPADPGTLANDVQELLSAVPPYAGPAPKALIAPHAGYVYSGPIAARVYARLAPCRHTISRVVLLGPAHRVAFRGIAASSANAFETPLGRVPVDRAMVDRLLEVPGVSTIDAAHAEEHSLEVHLPFLQRALDDFAVVPLVVGDAPASLVSDVLEAAWGGVETLIVISSDLSHYLDYANAQRMDEQTREAIEALEPDALTYHQACGRLPIAALLTVAKRHHLAVETIDLRNSGDTAGPRDRVVGYGAWSFVPGQGNGQHG